MLVQELCFLLQPVLKAFLIHPPVAAFFFRSQVTATVSLGDDVHAGRGFNSVQSAMKMEEAARPVQEEALASLESAEARVEQAEERCQRLLKEATEGEVHV